MPMGPEALYTILPALIIAAREGRVLRAVQRILERVHGDEGRIRSWLREPNPNLAGRSPLSVMASSPEWMRWLIDNVGAAS